MSPIRSSLESLEGDEILASCSGQEDLLEESIGQTVDPMIADRLIRLVDVGLRSVTGTGARADMPTERESALEEHEREVSAGLLRVNHTGEICAQGLYEGQAMVARSTNARKLLTGAAGEERTHLDWCRTRIEELGGRTSVFDSAFYVSSVVFGAAAGLLGDRVSLGFVEATEDQVCEHLDRHLVELPNKDKRSRDILKAIWSDEKRHGKTALARGGVAFPKSVRTLMTLASRVMTATTRRI